MHYSVCVFVCVWALHFCAHNKYEDLVSVSPGVSANSLKGGIPHAFYSVQHLASKTGSHTKIGSFLTHARFKKKKKKKKKAFFY